MTIMSLMIHNFINYSNKRFKSIEKNNSLFKKIQTFEEKK